ncbi:uncharacterized protein B0I36DRAFT_436373, partial [Microdochium trichocladiopsis]
MVMPKSITKPEWTTFGHSAVFDSSRAERVEDEAFFRTIPACNERLSRPGVRTWAPATSDVFAITLNTDLALKGFLVYWDEPARDAAAASNNNSQDISKSPAQKVEYTPGTSHLIPDADEVPLVREVHALLRTEIGLQSYPGLMQGGIVSALMDEITGLATVVNRIRGVRGFKEHLFMTSSITTAFARPVPTPATLVVTARIKELKGRVATVEGEIRNFEKGGETGPVLAKVDAVWAGIKLRDGKPVQFKFDTSSGIRPKLFGIVNLQTLMAARHPLMLRVRRRIKPLRAGHDVHGVVHHDSPVLLPGDRGSRGVQVRGTAHGPSTHAGPALRVVVVVISHIVHQIERGHAEHVARRAGFVEASIAPRAADGPAVVILHAPLAVGWGGGVGGQTELDKHDAEQRPERGEAARCDGAAGFDLRPDSNRGGRPCWRDVGCVREARGGRLADDDGGTGTIRKITRSAGGYSELQVQRQTHMQAMPTTNVNAILVLKSICRWKTSQAGSSVRPVVEGTRLTYKAVDVAASDRGEPGITCARLKKSCLPQGQDQPQHVKFVTFVAGVDPDMLGQSDIPLPINSPPDVLFTDHFITFLATCQLTKRFSALAPEFIHFIQSPGPLRDIALAIGALETSRKGSIRSSGRRENTDSTALSLYGRSIRTFSKDIAAPTFQPGEEALWTTFLLGLFELMSKVSSADAWSMHMIQGVSQIIKHIPSSAPLTPLGNELLEVCRCLGIHRAILYGADTSLEMHRIVEKADSSQFSAMRLSLELMLGASLLS